jgi:acyl-coenzyme A synthetase/AMP-(fatty) acid ligase
VPQAAVLDGRGFAELLSKHDVSVLWISVGLLSQYTAVLRDIFPQLRCLITGGDRFEPALADQVLSGNSLRRLINAYGPTECTTFSTTQTVVSVEPDATSIPIGRPIANAQVYILDTRRQPVPIGVAGEIYIGGDGVACGYLNRPELTDERFIPDPFGASSLGRLYRTGDLGRWRPDGSIDFLGRNDNQVKLRGFRIELGEIESTLLRHPKIKESVVLARKDGPTEKRLVAYVVPGDSLDAPSAEELRKHLKESLPEYMIPSAFLALEHLPLTPNGKVDRRALPEIDLATYATEEYEAPLGEIEITLAQIWQDLLAVPRVGRNDNFFELGGHSLHGLNLIARITQRFDAELSVIAIFQSPTIRELAEAIDLLGPDSSHEDRELQEMVL